MNNPHLHNPHLPGETFYLQGAGPHSVLLLHGFTATCSEVSWLGERLHAAGYSVLAPLLPGHGTHPDDLNRTSWQAWLDAAEAAFDELQRRAREEGRGGLVAVGGESNGGLLALALAARRPETAAVLAFAPAVRLRLGPAERMLLRLAAPILPAIPKGDLEGNTTWQGYRVNPPRAVLQLIRLQKVVAGLLPKLRAPLLIVQGCRDTTIDPGGAQALYEQAGSPVKSLHWLEESGHCVLLDSQREEAARLALDFLAGVLPR